MILLGKKHLERACVNGCENFAAVERANLCMHLRYVFLRMGRWSNRKILSLLFSMSCVFSLLSTDRLRTCGAKLSNGGRWGEDARVLFGRNKGWRGFGANLYWWTGGRSLYEKTFKCYSDLQFRRRVSWWVCCYLSQAIWKVRNLNLKSMKYCSSSYGR